MQGSRDISVIVPTLNAAATLGECLEHIGTGAGEVIVSDGGSDDTTVEIAQAFGARVVAGPPGRGGQLRKGAAAARGAWLLFLHADSFLPEDWPRATGMAPEGKAAFFRLRFRAPGGWARLAGAWANLRSRLGLPFGDQGMLISRKLYDRIGGYPDIPLMEDVAIARALGRRRIVLLDAAISTGAERYQAQGWFRRGTRNLILLARYLAGADPERLARLYRR